MRNLDKFLEIKDKINALVDEMSEQLAKDCETDFMTINEALEHLDYVKDEYLGYAQEMSEDFKEALFHWNNYIRKEVDNVIILADQNDVAIGKSH